MFHLDLSVGYLLAMAAWMCALVVAAVLLLGLRRRWKLQSKNLRWIHAGLSLCALLASLTAVELAVAIGCDTSDSVNMTNVSERWFARHVQKNAEGFRDSQPLLKHVPDGRRRIVFLGDSFTFGQGVPDVADRFSDRIGMALEHAQPGKYTVANLGLQGLGTAALTATLEQALNLGYEMDIVVYAICLNDIDDFYSDVSQLYRRMEPRRPTFFLFRDTYLLNLLYIHAQQFTIPELRMYDLMLLNWYGGVEWERMQRGLDNLQQICRKTGVDLRIAIFPMVHNLGPKYPFRAVHEQIAEYCRGKDIRVLDLDPVLAPHVGEGLVASRLDVHPSARAHHLAADAMQQKLLDDLFTPRTAGSEK